MASPSRSTVCSVKIGSGHSCASSHKVVNAADAVVEQLSQNQDRQGHATVRLGDVLRHHSSRRCRPTSASS